ncbi:MULTISPECIES: transglycosylase domain-containing protein [Mammaliicoccus]|uniref:transglycosylase domain-containing protein n=1 Tax=Mammaliicoccus TaxID=2803850 RepID=UPI00065BBB43|nr:MULTISPECIES: transglycosylase domain-containing protein [Mammaliicoccus]MBO1219134.1 penicillin-binding protein [Mammaliicoccus sciuri]MBO1232681.1 penicillin-binding protein [Mammaliicoccus sciuri]MDQ7129941.1 transglycosylase domain-containing protein [Mammaliicoccus sciuri]PNY91941.1 penicillin-binding protein [Mammaliicoccus sciuri]PTJ82972.1 penicillin-binding protein [Mammaliicoccus sciuri]
MSQSKASNSKNGKEQPKKKRNIKRTIIKVFGILVLAFLAMVIVGVLVFAYYAWKAPAFNESALKDQLPTKIYDKNNKLVTTLYMGQKREHVKFDEVPDKMKDAVLATEDNRFYDHGALDYKRLSGAVMKNFTGGFGSQGASTLTQQVVKRSFLTDKKSIERKAQEAYLSYRLEQEYSKDEIFEMYLNKIYYSDGIYGSQTAAKYYFNKKLKDLNLAETAYLAGLPQVPNQYNIYDNPEAAEKRKDTVLYLMERHGRITKKEMKEAQDTPIDKNLVKRTVEERNDAMTDTPDNEYASYINYVKQEITQNKAFKGQSLNDIMTSGLKIYTNMDKDVQKTLQESVDNGTFYKNKDQITGSSIVDTKTGKLVGISGGKNYKDVVDRNQATDVHPTGSSLKPILAYGPAIENMQYATNHKFQDESEYNINGSIFKNYDGQGHGSVTMADALARSYNIPALKSWQETNQNAGEKAVKDFASKVNLNYKDEIGPSEVLGGSQSEFSPTQLASAFASMGNGGTYNEAKSIRKVVTQDDETIKFSSESHKAMEDYTAYMLTEMLKGTFQAYGSAYGYGINGVNVAAKTGTGTYGDEVYNEYQLPENAAKDVWITGYSPQYTMSVWMGFNKVKEYGENSFLGHDEQTKPQILFNEVMSEISNYDGADFEKPDSVTGSGKSLSVAGNEDNDTTSSSAPSNSNGNSSSQQNNYNFSNNNNNVTTNEPQTNSNSSTTQQNNTQQQSSTNQNVTTEEQTTETPTSEESDSDSEDNSSASDAAKQAAKEEKDD